jgi:type I restriction enzyme M protein
MSEFEQFTNMYRDPSNVPATYRNHPSLRKLFKTDGFYVRPAEDPVTIWAIDVLHKKYNVPLEAMQLELSADFSEGTHESGRRYMGRSDLIIYDDRYQNAVGNLDVAFIMLEAMELAKNLKAMKI